MRYWIYAMPDKPACYSCLNDFCFRSNHKTLALYVTLLTFLCYTSYHASRKPISVVKTVLHGSSEKADSKRGGWEPFDGENWSQLLGGLEYAYLLVYAGSMFISGHLAERIDLRLFLTIGMLLSGLATIAFGLAEYLNIHSYSYFLIIQLFSGIVQSSGWPAVVTLMGIWWGTTRRGMIMGLWNAHTSAGNILGSLLAGAFVETHWGASFVVPGVLMLLMSLLVYLTLPAHPAEVLPSAEDTPINPSQSAPLLFSEKVDMEKTNNGKHSDANQFALAARNDAISMWDALWLPNVLSYAVLLFFAKLVAYTFLYWLPNYLTAIGGHYVGPEQAAKLSVIFDVGGILGGIVAGVISDIKTDRPSQSDTEIALQTIHLRSVTCALMLALAAPMLFLYQWLAPNNSSSSWVSLFICGALINGPYALITTAVSADLGTQPALQGKKRALATVTAIIDGTGSLGAAFGPFLTGLLVPFGWSTVFVMLLIADVFALGFALWIVYHTRSFPTRRPSRSPGLPSIWQHFTLPPTSKNRTLHHL